MTMIVFCYFTIMNKYFEFKLQNNWIATIIDWFQCITINEMC